MGRKEEVKITIDAGRKEISFFLTLKLCCFAYHLDVANEIIFDLDQVKDGFH